MVRSGRLTLALVVGLGILGAGCVAAAAPGAGVAERPCAKFSRKTGAVSRASEARGSARAGVTRREGLSLRGGAPARKKQQILDPKIIAGIQIAGMALQVWGWMQGHVKTVTIVGPALPVAGRLPVTLNLPPSPIEAQKGAAGSEVAATSHP